MDDKKIKKITGKHFKKLKERLEKATELYDAEAIHQFRVSYKKLRAFLRMISSSNDKKQKIKLSGKLKKVYRIAGSIRDLQLQQQRILEITKQSKKPWDYIYVLQDHINKLKPSLPKIISKKTFSKNKKKTTAHIPREFQLENFKSYSQHIWDEISVIRQKNNYTDTDIHEMRKHLKDLNYNRKEFADAESEILPDDEVKEDSEYYDQLLEQMGDFQDKCTAIDLLKPQWLYHLNKHNQELLRGIREFLLGEKRRIKRTMSNALVMDLTNPVTL